MKHTSWLSISLATFGCLIPFSAKAQVTPDGTTSTVVNGDGNNFTIEQGDRAGNNLFHSFNEFSVPTLGLAVFNNASDIANIFSRVTGSNISNIDGVLGANGTANLYLINPNGIIFGENARLNLGGSFLASTADSLLFEENTEFSAVNPQAAPLLEVSIPIGVRFRDNPGDITVRGDGNNDTQNTLEVGSNNTISILGGNLIFENASFGTRGGRIEIGSITDEKVDLVEASNGFTFDYSEVANFRDISFLENSVIDASGNVGGNVQVVGKNIFINDVSSIQANTLGNGIGNNIDIFALDSIVINGVENENNSFSNENNSLSGVYSRVLSGATGTGGDINIEANNLSLGNYSILTTDTLGEGNSGNINLNIINSLNLEIILESPTNISGIQSIVTDNAIGNGGNINISTQNLNIINGAGIFVNTFGRGNAGNISILSNQIEIDGRLTGSNFQFNETGLFADVGSQATGEGGNINLGNEQFLIQNLTLKNGGRLEANSSSSTSNNTSTISVFANNIEIDGGELPVSLARIDAGSFGDGQAGNINLGSERFPIQNLTIARGGVVATTTGGTNNAGTISIFADNIEIDGGDSFRVTGILSTAGVPASGQGGNINLGNEQFSINNLTITNGSRISVETFGQGDAGDMSIFSNNIEISGISEIRNVSSGLYASTASEANGNGGNIIVDTERLSITDKSGIFANNLGLGNAGNLEINANDIQLEKQGQIVVETAFNNGGNIILNIEDIVTLINNSLISAQALENATGGNVTINANNGFTIAFPNQNNDIIANASEGRGGNININTQAIFGLEVRPNDPLTNDIDASSGVDGLDGTIDINNPAVDPTTGLINLPESVGDASD